MIVERSFYTETYGCQMNVADMIELEEALEALGCQKVSNPIIASYVIINTCAVRHTAENRIYGRLGYFKHLKQKNPFTLFLMGCLAQKEQHNLIKKYPVIDYVIGPNHRDKILEIINREEIHFAHQVYGDFETDGLLNPVPDSTFPYRAFITIIQGCSKFCSYCIVPFTRGIEKSVPSSYLFKQIESLLTQGVVEVIFLGQNVNSYGIDNEDISFAQLLNQVSKFKQIQRIRFISSHPWDLSDELITELSQNPKISKGLHFALQSASNKVLEQMNRQHTFEDYFTKISKLKQAIPDICLSTDIIVGYPGETEEDFLETYHALDQLEFTHVFAFMYSPREGTDAYFFEDNVSLEEKKRRLQLILEKQKQIGQKQLERFIGKTIHVLVEKVMQKENTQVSGMSELGIPAFFQGKNDLIGQFCEVRVDQIVGRGFLCSSLR